jgi:hypothetical protein
MNAPRKSRDGLSSAQMAGTGISILFSLTVIIARQLPADNPERQTIRFYGFRKISNWKADVSARIRSAI